MQELHLFAIDQSYPKGERDVGHATPPLQGRQSVRVFGLQSERLQDSHQEEEQLGPGQGLPRADPLARRERDEALVSDDSPLLVEKALRVEPVPLLPVVVPLQEGLVVGQDKVSPWYLVTADLVVIMLLLTL